MADVSVAVMIDGKQAFVAGASGAPDPYAHAVGALQYALRHFQDVLGSRTPQPTPPSLSSAQGSAGQLAGQITMGGNLAGGKPKDTSL